MKKTLEDIRIATPCPASWADMTGTEKARFCAECRLHVYNLSAMTRAEAEELVARTEGRLCVRLYQRRDGTVLTQDCPVGLAEQARRRVRTLVASVGVLVAAALGIAAPLGRESALQGKNPFRVVLRWLGLEPPPPDRYAMGRMVMGEIDAAPPPPPSRTTSR